MASDARPARKGTAALLDSGAPEEEIYRMPPPRTITKVRVRLRHRGQLRVPSYVIDDK